MTEPQARPGKGRLAGKRALITRADDYMGPAVREKFIAEGCEVVADESAALEAAEIEEVVEGAGRIDILVANFLCRPTPKPATEISEPVWGEMFDAMVHPLMRYVRATLPGMLDRGSGKIVAHTSAAALRGIPGLTDYTAARSAQNGFLQALAAEIAPHGIQVNAIAQHFAESARGFRTDLGDQFDSWVRSCPSRRTAEGWECAELTAFLASDAAGFVTGATIPFDGGWSATGP